jgi:hypothetical protein
VQNSSCGRVILRVSAIQAMQEQTITDDNHSAGSALENPGSASL